jgi:hypothetical protein
LLFVCFCHPNLTDFTINKTFFTLDIQYLTMSFKSGSKCSINNLGFSEAADTVFATLLPIRGKLFPIIKVADIRYTAEIRALYPYRLKVFGAAHFNARCVTTTDR